MLTIVSNFSDHWLDIAAWAIILLGVVSFVSAFFLTTPYGRYSRYQVWGFGVNARLAWLVQECPSFLIPFSMFLSCKHTTDGRAFSLLVWSPNTFLITLFMVHYFRRSFIYPFWIKNTKPTPILIALFAFVFCSLNGYIQGHYHIYIANYPEGWFYNLHFLLGIALFFIGFAINVHADYVVTNLRKPGETGHKIPKGGLFEYISCPNFFGEIVEWAGFWLASSSLVAFAFFFNTIFQIGPRAFHHHRYYKEKFEDYPKNRKALIPFIV